MENSVFRHILRFNCTMTSKDRDTFTGIGKLSRQRLSQVLKCTKGYITPEMVAHCLHISPQQACSFLSSWAKRGWLLRIRQGIYLPIDIGASSRDEVLIDPWKLAAELYAPCYIGGWSAAQYWDLTEQIFESTIVVTTKRLAKKEQSIERMRFLIKHILPKKMFGLKTVWKDQIKVEVSDPHKTIVDMLDDPLLGGGITSIADFLLQYLDSNHSELNILIDYAERMQNRTIFKRLGYLISKLSPAQIKIQSECLKRISKGNTQLDPAMKGSRLIKKWGLWIPQGFAVTKENASNK